MQNSTRDKFTGVRSVCVTRARALSSTLCVRQGRLRLGSHRLVRCRRANQVGARKATRRTKTCTILHVVLDVIRVCRSAAPVRRYDFSVFHSPALHTSHLALETSDASETPVPTNRIHDSSRKRVSHPLSPWLLLSKINFAYQSRARS